MWINLRGLHYTFLNLNGRRIQDEGSAARMNLLSKNRRRNLFKVASFHLITAWLLLQIFDVVAPYFQLPVQFGTAVIFTLVAGFPVVCSLTMIFELTPQGFRRIGDNDYGDEQFQAGSWRHEEALRTIPIIVLESSFCNHYPESGC